MLKHLQSPGGTNVVPQSEHDMRALSGVDICLAKVESIGVVLDSCKGARNGHVYVPDHKKMLLALSTTQMYFPVMLIRRMLKLFVDTSAAGVNRVSPFFITENILESTG